MGGLNERALDEINGVRLIDIIESEMKLEQEEKGIYTNRLAREALNAMSELAADRRYTDMGNVAPIGIDSIATYIELYNPPVNKKALSKVIRVADNLDIKLKMELRNKPK